jgi:hypothetical protein
MSPALTPALAIAVVLLLAPGVGRADGAVDAGTQPVPSTVPANLRPRLKMDFETHAWATGGMLALVGASQYWSARIAPNHCRWCDPPQVDRWARGELLWKNKQAATLGSNLLVVAVPAGAAVTLGLWAHGAGAGFREGAEDLLVMTEAATISMSLMQVAKFTTARTRPDAWAGSGSKTANSRMSFYAGHAGTLFAVAASATQLGRLRGRPGWGWFAVISFAGAATCSWLRVASDNHWLTDVVAGAAVGTAVGLTLPGVVLHRANNGTAAVTLVPAPGGIALIF